MKKFSAVALTYLMLVLGVQVQSMAADQYMMEGYLVPLPPRSLDQQNWQPSQAAIQAVQAVANGGVPNNLITNLQPSLFISGDGDDIVPWLVGVYEAVGEALLSLRRLGFYQRSSDKSEEFPFGLLENGVPIPETADYSVVAMGKKTLEGEWITDLEGDQYMKKIVVLLGQLKVYKVDPNFTAVQLADYMRRVDLTTTTDMVVFDSADNIVASKVMTWGLNFGPVYPSQNFRLAYTKQGNNLVISFAGAPVNQSVSLQYRGNTTQWTSAGTTVNSGATGSGSFTVPITNDRLRIFRAAVQ